MIGDVRAVRFGLGAWYNGTQDTLREGQFFSRETVWNKTGLGTIFIHNLSQHRGIKPVYIVIIAICTQSNIHLKELQLAQTAKPASPLCKGKDTRNRL
jgi:hypothetical protein